MFKELFAEAFQVRKSEIREKENNLRYNVKFSFTVLKKTSKSKNYLKKAFETISIRDQGIATLSIDGVDPIELTKKENVNDFFNGVEEQLEIYQDDGEENTFYFEFTINKNIVENKLTFYSKDQFKKFMKKLEINEGINFFESLVNDYSYFYFIITDKYIKEKGIFYTDTFSISINYIEDELPELCSIRNRETLIEKRKEVSNITGNGTKILVPNDFIVKYDDLEMDCLKWIFDKLTFALCISFIFDITEISNGNLLYKLNGYKPIEGRINFSLDKIYNIQEIIRIYIWIYSDGNINDKVGLSRNIISLNLHNIDNEFYISDNTYSAVISSYEIYLKENVNKYIEVKNKVSEFMLNKSLETTNLIKGFMSSLKNSNYIFVTFFMSFIVFKALNPTSSNIFTKEIIYISYFVLGISFLYLILNLISIHLERKRFESQYKKLKRMYTDLLTEEDLSAIFLENEHQEDLDYIRKRTRLFAIIWFLEIILLLILVLVLGKTNSIW